MTAYLDASVLVALVGRETSSSAVTTWLTDYADVVLVSDFAAAESSAALARQRRVGRLTTVAADEAFAQLDDWIAQHTQASEIDRSDIAVATLWVRTPELTVRAPDAIHIAAASRLGATLLTLDKGMAHAATVLGVPYINPAEVQTPGMKD